MDVRAMEKDTLGGMSGFLLKIYGELVADSRGASDGSIWYRFAYSPGKQFKEATRAFIRDHNKQFGSHYSVSFPKPFKMTLREARKK